MQKSFGPSVTFTEGRPPRTSCITGQTYCFLLDGKKCRDKTPPREIPDPAATPDWCQFRAGIERDATDDAEMRELGLCDRDRSELSAMLKALPIEARGLCPKRKRPWALSEMSADTMRRALLRAHREGRS